MTTSRKTLSTLLALVPLGAFATFTIAACGARTATLGDIVGTPADPGDPRDPAPPPDAPDSGVCDVAFAAAIPGSSICGGCPTTARVAEPIQFQRTTAASTFTITSRELGRIMGNAGPGRWRIDSDEGENDGVIANGADGTYDTQVPLFCGPQVVQLGWCNQRGPRKLALAIERVDCIVGGLHATLSWGAGATDFELHFVKQGGRINDNATDCTWTSCLGGNGPDWGASGVTEDNPRKDIDATSENGIENIELPSPEPISYDVLVEYWGSGVPSAPSIVINTPYVTLRSEGPMMRPKDVWHIAKIDGRTGTVALQGVVVDCSGSWSSGCRLPLP